MKPYSALLCAVLFIGAMAAGCATPARLGKFDLGATGGVVPSSCLYRVPYIAQNDGKSCATTSAAMAISYYEGLDRPPLDKETAWRISGAKESDIYRIGNDMDALRRLANHYGYDGEFARNLTVANLETLLAHGALVVLNIKAYETGPQTHAILAVGYDRDLQALYVADPANGPDIHAFPYAALVQRWEAGLSHPRMYARHSGFVIYPKKN